MPDPAILLVIGTVFLALAAWLGYRRVRRNRQQGSREQAARIDARLASARRQQDRGQAQDVDLVHAIVTRPREPRGRGQEPDET